MNSGSEHVHGEPVEIAERECRICGYVVDRVIHG